MSDAEQRLKKFVLNRIKELLKTDSNKSLRTLSELMGHQTSYLSNLLRQQKMPTVSSINTICKYYGLTLSEFFNIDRPVNEPLDQVSNLLGEKMSNEDLLRLYDLVRTLDKLSLIHIYTHLFGDLPAAYGI